MMQDEIQRGKPLVCYDSGVLDNWTNTWVLHNHCLVKKGKLEVEGEGQHLGQPKMSLVLKKKIMNRFPNKFGGRSQRIIEIKAHATTG